MAISSENIIGHKPAQYGPNGYLVSQRETYFKHEYPLNNKEFPARIVFAVIPNTNEGGIAAALSDAIGQGIDVADSFTESEGNDKTLLEKGKGIYEMGKAAVQEAIAFYGDIKEELPHNGDLDKTTDEVRLYLPRAIAINDTATYDTAFQLGTIGGVAEMALTSGTNVLGAVAGSAIGTAWSEGKAFMGGSGMTPGMADILAQKRIAKMGASGQAIAGGMTAASKVTTNPNTRAMFKDVPLRSFSFNFTLIPTSKREADEIENIVKLFRTELYPITLSAGRIRVGYKFPNRFKITLKSGIKIDRAHPSHRRHHKPMSVKFLPTYLTNFGAVYNAGSSLLHKDGSFNQVDITLGFTETRALTQADVREGGY